MERLNLQGRNKNKHKFSGSRVCKTVVGKNNVYNMLFGDWITETFHTLLVKIYYQK